MSSRPRFHSPFLRSPATFVLLAQSMELGVAGNGRGGKGFIGLPRGIYGPSVPGEISHYELTDREVLKEAIGTCLDKAERLVHRAHLAIEGAIIRHMILPLPYLPTRDELATAVRTEVERYALFSGAEVTFDFTVLRHDPENGISLLFAAVRRTLVDELVEVFAEKGIEVVSIEPAPLSLVRSLLVDHPEVFEQSDPCGVLASLPYELFVSQWQDGELRAWRSIYAHTETLRLGDPLALADVQQEVQRTLREMTAHHWLVVEAPGPIEEVLANWPDTDLTPSLFRFDEAAMRGALVHQSTARSIAFNLLPAKPRSNRTMSRRQLGGLVAAALMALVALGINFALEQQIASVRAATERLQNAMTDLQIESAGLSVTGVGDSALVEQAQHETVSVVGLIERLREITPADCWMTDAKITADSTLEISGFSMSQNSPLELAQALSGLPEVQEVNSPGVQVDLTHGDPCYEFHLNAVLRAAKGGAR